MAELQSTLIKGIFETNNLTHTVTNLSDQDLTIKNIVNYNTSSDPSYGKIHIINTKNQNNSLTSAGITIDTPMTGNGSQTNIYPYNSSGNSYLGTPTAPWSYLYATEINSPVINVTSGGAFRLFGNSVYNTVSEFTFDANPGNNHQWVYILQTTNGHGIIWALTKGITTTKTSLTDRFGLYGAGLEITVPNVISMRTKSSNQRCYFIGGNASYQGYVYSFGWSENYTTGTNSGGLYKLFVNAFVGSQDNGTRTHYINYMITY